eukprot:1149951-Rhodomonas_salina.2
MLAVWLAYLDQHPDAVPSMPEHTAEAAAAAAELDLMPACSRHSLFMPGRFTYTDKGKCRLVYWKITLDARIVSDEGELHTEVMIVLLEAGGWGYFWTVQVQYHPSRRSRNAFKALKAGQHRYQLLIKPWSYEEKEFKFSAQFPFVEAVCLNCKKAVPPGLTASAAYEWMICHLMGLCHSTVSGSPPAAPAAPDAAADQLPSLALPSTPASAD